MPRPCALAFASVFFALVCSTALAAEPCDSTGSDAESLGIVRASIDSACPCDEAESRADYRRCAKATVATALEDQTLRTPCRREALRYAKLARCGIEGAVVCCRLDTTNDGRERHRVLDATDCVDDERYQTCTDSDVSIVTGCDASGCVTYCGDGIVEGEEECDWYVDPHCDAECHATPYCGDGVLDPGEQCEPADTDTCSPTCEIRDCSMVPDGCGDLVVGEGETCDPPGVGSCSNLCQAATCTAPAFGETEVACVEGAAEVAAAASASSYLLAWTGTHQHPGQFLGRRFDSALAPLDGTLQVLSDGEGCNGRAGGPSAASNGADFAVLWGLNVSASGSPSYSSSRIGYRSVDGGSGALGVLRTETVPGPGIGSCSGLWWTVPTTASGAPASPYALGWGQTSSRCIYWDSTVGRLWQPGADPETVNASSSYPITIYQGQASNPAAAILGETTLWTAYGAASDGMGNYVGFVSAAWTDGASTGSPFSLGSRGPDTTYGGRPAVAAGDASWLVAWREGNPAPNSIRAMRVTRAAGRIDANGGLLLATAAGSVSGGPSIAYDGTRWLVAWTETGVGGNDLKAVAIDTDGSIVDGTPRTIATQVAAQAPALASTGDGTVLVAFRRDDAGWSAIRAVEVVP